MSTVQGWQKYFVPVGGFFIFNLCDLLGRSLAGLTKWPGSSRSGSLVTFLLSLARLAFVPLLLFCNISPDNRHLTQVAFHSDAVFIALNILFSLSNGYIVNICMMSGRLAIQSIFDYFSAKQYLPSRKSYT